MQELTKLIVKHLPAELNVKDREDLLKLFGAKTVRCLSDQGRMKYTVFATFATHNEAKIALSRLHQLDILNRKLVVEFAKIEHQSEFPKQDDYTGLKSSEQDEKLSKIPEKEKLKAEVEKFCKNLHGVCPELSLEYIPSPLLKYKYPPPTPSIIANISHALVSVPKFYTQVLHLMNKMNLPTPFGTLTPTPPIASDRPLDIQHQEKFLTLPDRDVSENKDMDTSSSEESELESDIEIPKTDIILPLKRPMGKVKKQYKKPKFHQPVINQPQPSSRTEPSDVFETQPSLDAQKKIQFNIKPTLKSESMVDYDKDSISKKEQSGFGIIVATKIDNDTNKNEESEDESLKISEFISLQELKRKRISHREMKTLSIFRNYDPGEPTVRLYIKNLARQVEEKDLRYIFGRFIDTDSELDKNMFDIRLMKEGRMKGQAFVTLANEKQAVDAVKETNGFVLHTKPLVVQFARSAKPKDAPKDQKKK